MECEIALTAWANNPARLRYFETTMASMRQLLTASRHELTRLFVCSEELSPEYREPFEKICLVYGVELHYHQGPPEIGGNHNLLCSLCKSPYVLFTEDDCLQHAVLDLSRDIEFLEDNGDVVYVRYSLSHPCTVRALQPIVPGLGKLSKDEPYVYSNRAHLRHRERFASLGPFVENGAWGAQELGMNQQVKLSPYRVVGRVPNYFEHCGKFAAESSRWPKGETP